MASQSPCRLPRQEFAAESQAGSPWDKASYLALQAYGWCKDWTLPLHGKHSWWQLTTIKIQQQLDAHILKSPIVCTGDTIRRLMWHRRLLVLCLLHALLLPSLDSAQPSVLNPVCSTQCAQPSVLKTDSMWLQSMRLWGWNAQTHLTVPLMCELKCRVHGDSHSWSCGFVTNHLKTNNDIHILWNHEPMLLWIAALCIHSPFDVKLHAGI